MLIYCLEALIIEILRAFSFSFFFAALRQQSDRVTVLIHVSEEQAGEANAVIRYESTNHSSDALRVMAITVM